MATYEAHKTTTPLTGNGLLDFAKRKYALIRSPPGSPPRVWGKSWLSPAHHSLPRFTPTCVGKIYPSYGER